MHSKPTENTQGEEVPSLMNKTTSLTEKYPVRKDGRGLDARAFFRQIFMNEADTLSKKRNVLTYTNGNSGQYLPESYLLNGLEQAGITIEDLIEANLLNLNHKAYQLPQLDYKEKDFIAFTSEKIQNPHKKTLKRLVDIIQTKSVTNRKTNRSVPAKISQKQSPTPNILMKSNAQTQEQAAAIAKVQSKVTFKDSPVMLANQHIQSSKELGIQPLYMQSDSQQSERKTKTADLRTPLGSINQWKNIQQDVQEQFQRDPSLHNLEISKQMEDPRFNRQDSNSRRLLHGVSEILHMLSPLEEIGENEIESQESVPLKILKKKFKEQLRERTKSEQKALLIRYMKKKHRRSATISKDPVNNVLLTEQGYKERAERRMKKREKQIKKGKLVRGMAGYASGTESSNSVSSHSSVSFDGVPDQDLQHCKDNKKAQEIRERRDLRRRIRFHNQFVIHVEHSVKQEISAGLSKVANNSNASPSSAVLDSSLLELFQNDKSFAHLRQKLQGSHSTLLDVKQNEKKVKETIEQSHKDVVKFQLPTLDELNRMRQRLERAMELENSTSRDTEARVAISLNQKPPMHQSEVSLTQRESEMFMLKPIFSRKSALDLDQNAKLEQLQGSLNETIAELRAELAVANMSEDQFLKMTFGTKLPSLAPKAETIEPVVPQGAGLPKPSYVGELVQYIHNKDEIAKRLRVFNKSSNKTSTSPKLFEDQKQERCLEARLVQLALGKAVQVLKNRETKHHLLQEQIHNEKPKRDRNQQHVTTSHQNNLLTQRIIAFPGNLG